MNQLMNTYRNEPDNEHIEMNKSSNNNNNETNKTEMLKLSSKYYKHKF